MWDEMDLIDDFNPLNEEELKERALLYIKKHPNEVTPIIEAISKGATEKELCHIYDRLQVEAEVFHLEEGIW